MGLHLDVPSSRLGASIHLGLGRATHPESSDGIPDLLRRALRQPRWVTLATLASLGLAAALAGRSLAGHGQHARWWIATDVAAVLIFGIGCWAERRLGTVELRYRLNGEDRTRWSRLLGAFSALQATTVWHVVARGGVDDPRHRASASHLLDRRRVRPSVTLPSSVASNLLVPSLPAGADVLWFFPDRLVIYSGTQLTALAYGELEIESRTTQFIEGDPVPPDAQVIEQPSFFRQQRGRASDGDPRGAGSRRSPLCLYGRLDLSSASGLRASFLCSRPKPLLELAGALEGLRG